jgi:hypothetical protein
VARNPRRPTIGAGAMKLYHFCRTSDLDSIAEKGLYPHVAHESIMSLGHEVVWLTTQETTATTDEDVEHYRRLCLWTEEEIEETRRHGWLLDTGRTHRLTVRVRSGAKLQNYGDWLRANGDVVIINENGMAQANDAGELYAVRHMAAALSPRALREWWWVYFGTIPPSKIEGLPEQIKKKKKPWAIEEDTTLEIALKKFIQSETTRLAP